MIDKKLVVICTLIVVLIVGGIVGYKIYKLNNTENEVVQMENKTNTTNINTQKNEIEEVKKEENKVEEEIKEDNTTTESNTQNTEIKGKEEVDTQNEKENESNKKEQALDLVKKEWGEDNTVYYTVDSNSGNIYNISVRSKATTEALIEYEVDVTKKTVVMK